MRRICIYLTYDRQQIADRYIGYMLKELKTCSDYLAVVCNETEVVRGKEMLESCADVIFYRENTGFDAGGYNDALCSLIGWERVLAFDELVLVNDSLFGPFRPMKDIFAEMDEKEADFWGLAKHAEYRKDGFDYFPEHIQSFFFVFRSRMLHSIHFRSYWEKEPYYKSYNEAVRKYEMQFTSWFSGLGYSYAVLADTKANDSDNLENNYRQFARISYELIKKRNFPFLKKQQLAEESLDIQTQENLRQAIDYIEKETDYDADLIWENIIRSLNMSDLQRSLHLQYIVSPKEAETRADTVVLAVVRYENAVEYVLEYLQDLKRSYDVKILSYDHALLEIYEERGFPGMHIRRGEERKLSETVHGYGYVCVLHDTDLSSVEKPSCTGKSYFYHIWENMVKNKEHVSGILELFRKEPRLGLLVPPEPGFAEYFGNLGKGWNGEFERVRCVVKELAPGCRIEEELPPFGVSGDFWIRGCILGSLTGVKTEHFPYLQYSWSFLAQDAGFYSGIVESAEYASMNEVNLQYYLNEIAEQIRRQYGEFPDFTGMKKKISMAALREFCDRHSRIFVYGTGFMARKYGELIGNAEAYVISDGQAKPGEWNGAPVRYLSEVSVSEDCGIVLCMNKKNQAQVKRLLAERGIMNYLCI